jgi:hypothetical protein
MGWHWPLAARTPIPKQGEPGAFGSRRKHDTHTGVDLYCVSGDLVSAVEDGRIVNIEQFTGKAVGSPWWLDTWAILVEGESGVVAYCELERPTSNMLWHIGMYIRTSDSLGRVTRVLPRDKGLPHTMLHLELYTAGTRTTSWWREERPRNMLDPTPFLQRVP